jgi:hypothetical protein
MVYLGFGVNYKSSQTNWSKDIIYFNKIGLNTIRPNLKSVPIPWSAGTPTLGTTANINAYWRLCAQTFANAGFFVTWGCSGPQGEGSPGGGGLTATLWASYHTAMISEATYLQSQGIALGDFELGNELESFIDGTTLTLAQLNVNIRQLATDVKAVYNLSPISYATHSDASLTDWIANGLGGLDTISFHPYGTINISAQTVSFTVPNNQISEMFSAFGTKAYISEFNLDADASDLAALKTAPTVSNMQTFFSTITSSGLNKFILYSFVGELNADNQFAQLYTNGSTNPMWFDFFTSNPTQYSTGQRADVIRTSVNRTSVPNRTSYPARPLFQ